MHIFYALVSFLMINTLHLLMDTATLSSMIGYNNWNEFINKAPNNEVSKHTIFGKTIDSNVQCKCMYTSKIKEAHQANNNNILLAWVYLLGMFPTLLSSFGMLQIYYTKFHPWKSNNISVGFEPKDMEFWKPDLGKGCMSFYGQSFR